MQGIGEKSSSSGYGGSQIESNQEGIYVDEIKLTDDAVTILEQHPGFVKAIKVASLKKKQTSYGSNSSGGTLTTIPEGKIDFSIPRPIWPRRNSRKRSEKFDDALLLYASLNSLPSGTPTMEELTVREVLVELLRSINAVMEGKEGMTAEDILLKINKEISSSLDALKHGAEEDMRKLSVNLSNNKKISSVVRAFSRSSSSGTSSHGSIEPEEIYQVPSGSSSSGFSDSVKFDVSQLPVFVHEDLASVPNGVRNAMIYGTLCRNNGKNATEKLLDKEKAEEAPKKSLLRAVDDKPSVWEQYYGVKIEQHEVGTTYVPKPSDVPLFVSTF